MYVAFAYIIKKQYDYQVWTFIFLFLFFWLHQQYVQIPRLGIEPKPQQGP